MGRSHGFLNPEAQGLGFRVEGLGFRVCTLPPGGSPPLSQTPRPPKNVVPSTLVGEGEIPCCVPAWMFHCFSPSFRMTRKNLTPFRNMPHSQGIVPSRIQQYPNPQPQPVDVLEGF